MDEPGDEDGGSRVPSRPTVKKKDGLDDPALADAGPDLDSPGETFNQGPNHPAAVAEESHLHGVDDDLNDSAAGVSGNPDDVAPQSGLNSGDTGTEAVSIVLDGVAPLGGNPDGISAEVVQSPSNVAIGGISNPNDVAQAGVVGIPASDLPSGEVFSLGDTGPDSCPEIVEVKQDSALEREHQNEDQIPREIVSTSESHNNTADEGADTADEDLWSKAVAKQDCKKLTELLAKDVTYFWKYETKNVFGTALHAAAAGDDLELVEHVLIMLSWAQKAGDQDLQFFDKNLDIDGYVELERDGKTAAAVAQEKNHVAIEKRIRDYIADRDQVRSYDEKRSTDEKRTGSLLNRALPKILRWNDVIKKKDLAPSEISEWNDAIKKKDCSALLKICPNKSSRDDSITVEEKRLIHGVVDLELENGKGGRRTALQTAAMQGCFQLAKLMLDHFKQVPSSIASGDDVVNYILARDEESGLTAFEMANDVIGHRSIAEYIKVTYRTYASNDKLKRMLHLNVENDEHMISLYWLKSFDAYPGTRWYRALENGDTRELKKLVEANSRFVLETCHGLTVLHVAILWDDLELVKVVLNLFCHTGKDGDTCIEWGKSYYPHELSLVHMMEERRKIGWDALRNFNILPKSMLKQLERKGNSLKNFVNIWTKFCPESREILDECTKAINRASTNLTLTSNIEFPTMPSRMSNFLTKYWPSEFDEDFKQDVDFNFEDSTRKKWLRFHFACKDPLKFKGFLQEMASYIMQHPYDATKLLQTWDGKGRTPFHILMDDYNQKLDPRWPFHEIFNHECFKEWIQIVENPRGKRIMDNVLTKNYLQQNVILHPWTYFKVNFNHEKFEHLVVTTFLYYQFAYLLKQKDMDEEIWSRFLDKKDLTNVMKEDQHAFNSMLFLAASAGNHTCLQLLLEINHDPMIMDSNGRSLLHHAADPSILLSQLLGHCSLTVEDVSNVRRKFMGSNTIYDPQPSSSATCDENVNGSNVVRETSSNSTIQHNTSISNSMHGLNSNSLHVSSGERSNVGRKACILLLLQAGVDLGQPDKDSKIPTIGPTIDATYQSWWYDVVVKDSADKKQALSQAGNALSVVGTLVAATSYVGPLQPPLGFDTDVGIGFVKTTEPLIKVFMVSNSVAFYLAMASVMFAVVSSLPMPQEGVLNELNRAKHVISLSLCFLQIAIGAVIVSFASASIVAIRNEQMFRPSDLLFSPSIIGLFFCLLGIGGFLIRLARLVLYRNRIVRIIYQFSFSKYTLWVLARCLWLILVVLFGLVYYPSYMILTCLKFLNDWVPFTGPGLWFMLWHTRYRLENFFNDVIQM